MVILELIHAKKLLSQGGSAFIRPRPREYFGAPSRGDSG